MTDTYICFPHLFIMIHHIASYRPPGLLHLSAHGAEEDNTAINEFEREYASLKPMGYEEKIIFCDFLLIALLWFFRDPRGYPGWTAPLPNPDYVTDGTVAMIGALTLFIIPRKDFFVEERQV